MADTRTTRRVVLNLLESGCGVFARRNPARTSVEAERPGDRAEIAARFQNLRCRGPHRLTQARLAGLIGICRQSVSEIENARVMPHASTWIRFLDLERKYREGAEMMIFLQSTASGFRFIES